MPNDDPTTPPYPPFLESYLKRDDLPSFPFVMEEEETGDRFLTEKTGYLIKLTNEQLAEVWPITILSEEEMVAARAKQEAESKAFQEMMDVRLEKAPEALQPIIELHSAYEGGCMGCDAGAYAEDSPEWPCRTINLILEGLE